MLVHVHDVFQPQVEGFTDQGMTDGNFEKAWDLFAEKTNVLKVQVVAGIQAQPGCRGVTGGLGIMLADIVAGLFAAACLQGMAYWL